MLTEDVELQVIGPPVLVSGATAASVDELGVGVDRTSAGRRRHDVGVCGGCEDRKRSLREEEKQGAEGEGCLVYVLNYRGPKAWPTRRSYPART